MKILVMPNEPPHGKTKNLHTIRRKQKAQISFAVLNSEADQRLCFRYTDSTIPLLSKSKFLSFLPSSETVQPGLCRTWSEPKLFVFSRTGPNDSADLSEV